MLQGQIWEEVAMGREQEMISREMAEAEIANAVRRLALLYPAFAEHRGWSYIDRPGPGEGSSE